MQRYVIKTGQWTCNGEFVGTGYSGHGHFLNDITKTQVLGGPLPVGKYKIEAPRNSPRLGPDVMNLTPLPGTEMFGRSLFRVHGDTAKHDHSASEGCIVMGHMQRLAIGISREHGDNNILEVVAE